VKETDKEQCRKETVYVMTTELYNTAPLSGKIFNILWAAFAEQIMMDHKQCENVEHFSYLGSMTTQDARNTREIKSRSAIAKAAFNTRLYSPVNWTLFNKKTSRQCYMWTAAWYGAETWTLGKVNQKYLESHGMWCCRRMGKISWTDLVRNEKVLKNQ